MNNLKYGVRVARLAVLLKAKMPPSVIATECRLVLEAVHGGPWGAVRALAKEAAQKAWVWRVAGPLRRLAHRLGVHDQEGPGGSCGMCRAQAYLKSEGIRW